MKVEVEERSIISRDVVVSRTVIHHGVPQTGERSGNKTKERSWNKIKEHSRKKRRRNQCSILSG